MDSFEVLENDPFFPVKIPQFLSYWMSKVPGPTAFKRLLLPGSFCSNSSSLSTPKIKLPFCKTQKISIFDQLSMGVRFLDFCYGQSTKSTKKNTEKHDKILCTSNGPRRLVAVNKHCQGTLLCRPDSTPPKTPLQNLTIRLVSIERLDKREPVHRAKPE